MFGLFKDKEPKCPVSEETRLWIENSFIWLINQFGEEVITSKKIMLPAKENFPIDFNGTEQSAYDALSIVATQMDVIPTNIELSFYNEQLMEIRNEMGTISLIGQQYEDELYSSGMYHPEKKDGKFLISIEKSILGDPEKLVATLAHEIAHIKILGEKRLDFNDERLTDLVTVFFGMGIFNANTTFKFQTDNEKWTFSKQGYLLQREWGYALAIYSYVKEEEKPDWIKFLTPNIQSDIKKSFVYISNNKDKVLV